MKMPKMNIQNLPYFAIAGIVLLLSMLLYTTTLSGFAAWILPTYLTEALLFFVLAFALWKSFKKSGFTVFIMSLVWLFNQMLHWSGLGAYGMALDGGVWLLLLVEGALTVLFFLDKPIKYLDFQSEAWPYASAFVLLLFGLAKVYIDISSGLSTMYILWAMGIALISFGYIIRPKTKDGSAALQILGLIFAVVAAFGVQGSGLALVYI